MSLGWTVTPASIVAEVFDDINDILARATNASSDMNTITNKFNEFVADLPNSYIDVGSFDSSLPPAVKMSVAPEEDGSAESEESLAKSMLLSAHSAVVNMAGEFVESIGGVLGDDGYIRFPSTGVNAKASEELANIIGVAVVENLVPIQLFSETTSSIHSDSSARYASLGHRLPNAHAAASSTYSAHMKCVADAIIAKDAAAASYKIGSKILVSALKLLPQYSELYVQSLSASLEYLKAAMRGYEVETQSSVATEALRSKLNAAIMRYIDYTKNMVELDFAKFTKIMADGAAVESSYYKTMYAMADKFASELAGSMTTISNRHAGALNALHTNRSVQVGVAL